MNNTTGYYNFRTNEYDMLDEAPADWSAYISQEPAAQALYKLYQDIGDTPSEAALKVLRLTIGLPGEPTQ